MGWVIPAIMAASSLYGAYANKRAGDKNSGGGNKRFFENWETQQFLPPGMRWDPNGGSADRPMNSILNAGIGNIGQLIKNPGALNPNIAGAIGPRAAIESEGIAQNFRGIGANQQGMAARTNAPVSIKNALSSALDVAQSRAQRDNRRNLMTDSENLRRQDTNQTYNLLGTILDYINGGRGIASNENMQSRQFNQQNTSAGIGALGSLISSLGSMGGGGASASTGIGNWGQAGGYM